MTHNTVQRITSYSPRDDKVNELVDAVNRLADSHTELTNRCQRLEDDHDHLAAELEAMAEPASAPRRMTALTLHYSDATSHMIRLEKSL